MVFWTVVGILMAALLTGMWQLDRRTAARGARVVDPGTIGRSLDSKSRVNEHGPAGGDVGGGGGY
jgi:hypothetical protein